MKKLTICLIGIDGSGKTTHVMAILRMLSAMGFNCKFAYMRGVGFKFFSAPFIVLSKILGYEMDFDGSTPALQRHFAFRFKDTIIGDIWSFLRLVDVVILITIRRYLTRARIIVCDRYIYDTIVDLSIILQKNILCRRYVSFLAQAVKPDLVLLLDLDEKEAYRRKHEHGLSALKNRSEIYRELAKKWNMHIIRSDRPLERVQNEIFQYVKGALDIEWPSKNKSPSIKVAIIISNLHDLRRTGPQKVGFTLAKHLSDTGVQVLIITNSIDERSPRVKVDGNLKMLVIPGNANFSTYARHMFFILKETKRFQPSIIHGHGFSSTILTALLGKIFRVPTIQTTYDLPITSKTPKKLELGGLFFVDHVICTSEFIREYLAKVGIPTGNAVVIPYGIEDVWFPLSKSHFVESGGIEVLFFGDAKAERGTDVLLKSISKVAESHSDVHFTFAIREHEPACVERLKKLSGLYPIKILLRDNRHISEVASQGDIIVLPYLLTTMQPPLTLIEGMLLGKAVITTDVEANREFIGANQRGLLIEPSNVEALVQALDLLLSDPGKRRNLGTSASQFILEIYNWDEVVQKIFSLYRYCLDGTTTGND